MSRRYTEASLDGQPEAAWASDGHVPADEAMRQLRAYWMQQAQIAQAVIAAPDEAFEIRFTGGDGARSRDRRIIQIRTACATSNCRHRCGECRLGLGKHLTCDPQCRHHQEEDERWKQ